MPLQMLKLLPKENTGLRLFVIVIVSVPVFPNPSLTMTIYEAGEILKSVNTLWNGPMQEVSVMASTGQDGEGYGG